MDPTISVENGVVTITQLQTYVLADYIAIQQANLAQLQSNLASTQAQVDSINSAISALEATIASLQADQ